MTGFFSGLATALITPFYKDGGINFDALQKLIDKQIEGGCDVLVIAGTTGEPATMTDEELDELMRFAVKYTNGRAKLVFGSGGNCTAKAVKMSIKAQEIGADGLLVVTPYYNKCTQNGIYEYYKAINDAVNIPIICYNVPSRTGVNILPATMERIATLKNIAGIKEACGNMEQICETMRRIRGKCDMYSGDDNLNIPITAIGGSGIISVASNLVPADVKKVFTLTKAGKLGEANALQDKLLPVIDACFMEVNPIPAKAGVRMLGIDVGVPRAPLTEMEEAHQEKMKEILTAYGLEICK